jgi:hypothetical protein
MEIQFEPNVKQDMVFDLFEDNVTTEIVYGGSAGGGKSYMLCALLIIKALEMPGIRIGLARNELTTLKKTTIVSFFEVANDWGVGELFNYNSTAGTIKFDNGSEIILVELTYKPSDPNYTRLGGHLFTFGVVDEVGEVDQRGYQIFKTRLGRWKNDEFNIKPICISTCNPIKNWLYREFYKPHVDGHLEEHMKFIQALPTDNPYLSSGYLDNLRRLPFIERERLLNGNWEYESSPNDMLTYDEILNVWDNPIRHSEKNQPKAKYITADIAFTSDKCVLMVWYDFVVVEMMINPDDIEVALNDMASKHNIPQYQIAYDSDGVGKFLTTKLRNAKAIVNNARAHKGENYKNLKTQLYYKLVEKVKDNSVKFLTDEYKQEIIEELQVVRYKPSTTVGKLEMISKGDVKKMLGRSPDFSDAMAYRMQFEFKNTNMRTFNIG